MNRSGSQFLLPAAFVAAAALATACGGGGGGGGNVVDNTPPTVVATDPPAGAVGVQLADLIIATFSETINPTSVTAGSFQVTDDMSNPVNGTVSTSGRTARFNPANNALVKSAIYHAMLTTGIKDSAGNPLSANFDWTFSTTADMWTSTAVNASTPTARSDHTAIWTGTEMIVWGGVDASGVANTGARYNPTNPNATAWSATDTTMANVPLARTDHTAIWDDVDNEMIVWGGTLGATILTNTGGRYSPVANSWKTTPTGTAPLPRSRHTAVWTGTQMIVWGGGTSLGLTNDGGRFDPNGGGGAGARTPTSQSGAPTVRVEHTAIWTGTEMIVWGGMTSFGITNDGGRFDPNGGGGAGAWTPTSQSGAPTVRVEHTAIWTGTEMIVWGGSAAPSFGPSLDGARYSPMTNTWKPMTDAPVARMGHEAIWTGTEMIVWGGNNADNTGAAYNPAHDSWRTISTATGAPTGRNGHTAVWTGNEMIVWGGNESVGPSNSGARYTP